MVCTLIVCRISDTKLELIGGVGDTTVPNYSGAMIVVGGSGVTFALSAVQDLVFTGAKSRVQVIDLIWSVSHPGLTFVCPFVCFRVTELLCQLP